MVFNNILKSLNIPSNCPNCPKNNMKKDFLIGKLCISRKS